MDLGVSDSGGGTVPPADVPDGPGEYGALPIKKVAANPRNPRKVFRGLDGLANSIRTDGQLQPVTVVTRAAYLALFPDDAAAIAKAEWVACMGSRRINAIQQAPDLTTVNAVVDDRLAESALRFHKAAVEENQNRADLTPMEEGRAFIEIADVIGYGGQTKVAEMFILSKAYVSQRIKLLKLIDPMQAILDRSDYKELVPLSTAVTLAQLDAAEQETVAKPILALPAEEQYAAWKMWAASSRDASTVAPAPAAPEPVHDVNNIEPARSAPAAPAAPEPTPATPSADGATPPEVSAAPVPAAAEPPAAHAPAAGLAVPSAPPRRTAEDTAAAPVPNVPEQTTPVAAAPSAKDDTAVRAAVSVLKRYDAETIATMLIAECDPDDVSRLAEVLYERVSAA
nr:ParB/RepB/Spo0J family partition protein [Glycomyces amatae]